MILKNDVGLHEALKKAEIDDPHTLHIPGGSPRSMRENTGKDPVYELLASKKAVRRMQACCAQAVNDSIAAVSRHWFRSFTCDLIGYAVVSKHTARYGA